MSNACLSGTREKPDSPLGSVSGDKTGKYNDKSWTDTTTNFFEKLNSSMFSVVRFKLCFSSGYTTKALLWPV